MALKIGQVIKKTFWEMKQEELWQFVQSDPLLQHFIKKNHQLLKFELLDLSESLTFRVGLQNGVIDGHSPMVTGCAFVQELGSFCMPDSISANRFKMSFSSIIRSLLFYTIHSHTIVDRENLMVVNKEMEINQDAVFEYVSMLTNRMPYNIHMAQDDHGNNKIIFIPEERLGVQGTRINVPYELAPELMKLEPFKADIAFKFDIQCFVSQIFVFACTPAEAQNIISKSKEQRNTEKVMAEAKELLEKAK